MALSNPDLPQYIIDIVKRRKELGITQEELAAKLGVRSTYICMFENNKRRLSMLLLCVLCDELGLTIRLLAED